ncbi:gamma-secretase-activating protein isoform X3 [Python bivittatus]|uniref:Gamma-secretase-activating protein isoform X3 n=1 Tax=Python bivittatus TaxID=176946 RepID=A0A9F5J7H2_PYTBI|nr:gamma-secretase-activating protein isoform X3 [Python bivittatus]
MLCQLSARFDPRRDVAPWLSERAAAERRGRAGSADTWGNNLETLYIINVERNGNVLYTWKGAQEYTNIGLYDHNSKKNQHLYTFEKDLRVISCSINHEKTLLAISFLQTAQEEKKLLFQPVSKCLTLLIEIHPLNNVKVLKAVDSYVRVQFLYPVTEKKLFPDSCLLLISEDKYVEKLDIRTVKEGDRVMIENSSRLSKERIADDFIWYQWDMLEQRLFYIVTKEERDTLNGIQFYPNKDFKLILEAPLEISLTDIRLKSVNLDYSYYQDQEPIPKPLDVRVFTSDVGSLCLCYSLATLNSKEVTYSVCFLHKGYSKTYTTTLEKMDSLEIKELAFLDLDSYVAAYLPGRFLHLLNTQHPDLICHSFFLTGEDAEINQLNTSTVFSPVKSSILDRSTGRIFTVAMNQKALLQFLWNSKLDNDKLAALHCLLLHVGSTVDLENQIIQWISDNVSTCFAFDPIQELIIASLYWKMCLESINLEKLLPYTSLLNWKEDVPGILCKTHIISLPFLKVQNCKGFWEKLNLNLEYVKYVEPPLHFSHQVLRREWNKLLSDQKTAARTTYIKSIFENTKKVLSSLNTWETERIAPLFQDEDYQQRLLTGLMVAQLKDHLLRPLQYVGKKKIDQIAVDYVSKLLDLICRMMENIWRKYSLSSLSFSFRQQGKANEIIVFHIMCQILQATSGMCLPLPPGFHTLHLEIGMRCFPLHTVLQYVDHGVLHLTEKYVMNLWKELDNTEKNVKLKLSILTRLPQAIGCKICQLWNHSLSSNAIARNYVKLLFEKLRNKQCNILFTDRISAQIEFLPLNYLVAIIVEMEHQGWAASMEQTNMNARLVEELALKHTTMLLGL